MVNSLAHRTTWLRSDFPPQEKPQVAEVVAVGPGKTVDGKLVPVQLKVGDKVLMSKYSGTEVKVDGEEYTILREEDILAVVE